jgi:hypothetical protein
LPCHTGKQQLKRQHGGDMVARMWEKDREASLSGQKKHTWGRAGRLRVETRTRIPRDGPRVYILGRPAEGGREIRGTHSVPPSSRLVDRACRRRAEIACIPPGDGGNAPGEAQLQQQPAAVSRSRRGNTGRPCAYEDRAPILVVHGGLLCVPCNGGRRCGLIQPAAVQIRTEDGRECRKRDGHPPGPMLSPACDRFPSAGNPRLVLFAYL